MLISLVKAFVVGGGICLVGQVILNVTNITNGKILVLFLLSGGVLQAFGLYQPLVEFAGAGASVPISGFGASLVSGAVTASQEQGFIGALTGALTATAMGITVAIVSGYIVAMVSKPATKKK